MMTQSLDIRTRQNHENTASTTESTLVIESNQLCAEHIYKLHNKSVLSVRIPNFFPEDMCRDYAEMILSHHPSVSAYFDAPNLLRTGRTLFDTVGKEPEVLDEYFTLGEMLMPEERRLFNLRFSPINKLRLELEELTPYGFRLETLYGRNLWMGATRIFNDGSFALPHIDSKKIDIPDCWEAKTIGSQIAVNCYVDLPISGGELEIYDFEPTDSELADLATDTYGLNASKLPAPALVIKPKLGELVLFRSTNVHAVRPSNGTRIAQSCFLAYRTNSAITGWS
jgi:2OG-Fe(II) oxygenase superfamily